jgi:sterol desaturase/sphingolipid hydroxylase (fatty acid hydroxylase superfamily)
VIAAAVLVGTALVIIGAERWFPYDRQRFLRAGLGVDLVGYALVQSAVLAVVIRGLVGAIDRATGGAGHGLVGGWPFAAQLAFFVVTHDLYIYWFHRVQHAWPLLWRVHEAHHSAREVDWIAGSRSHALEITINQTIELGAMVLLGATADVIVWKGVISVAWGMWIHANVDVRTGWLQYVINGPELHRWHHALDVPMPGRNYATKLAVWDWLFGTAWRPARKPRGYGLADAFPRGFLAQQAHAFRRR